MATTESDSYGVPALDYDDPIGSLREGDVILCRNQRKALQWYYGLNDEFKAVLYHPHFAFEPRRRPRTVVSAVVNDPAVRATVVGRDHLAVDQRGEA